MDSFVREGVYVHISGPNYETPLESIFLLNIGADAVGMSTAPEVIVVRHADIRVLGKQLFLCYRFLQCCINSVGIQCKQVHIDYEGVLRLPMSA